MIAARLHGRGDLRLEEIDEPEPGAGEIKVEVAQNGLCGSDVHEYFSGPLMCSDTPHPLTGAVLPQIQGHEFAGTVTALGDGVTDLAPGARVCIEPIYSCGRCPSCTAGQANLCRLLASHGNAAPGGGLSQFTVVPRSFAHALPDSLSLEQGALVEPMAVAYHAVLRSKIEPGEAAVVFGAGPIGIGVFLSLRATGVDEVTIVEPAPARRTAVEALGAVDVIDPAMCDVVTEVQRRTSRRGADAVFDCAGSPSSFDAAPFVTAPHGRIVVLAIFEETVTFNPSLLMLGEVEIVGSTAYAPGVFDRVIALMETGAYPTAGWVEHIPFDQVIPDGLEALRRGERTKVLVDLP